MRWCIAASTSGLQRPFVPAERRQRDLLDDRDGDLDFAFHPHDAAVEDKQMKAFAGRESRHRPPSLLQLVMQALVRGALLADRAHGEVVEPAQRVLAVHVLDQGREHDLVAAVYGERGHEEVLGPRGQLARHVAQPHGEHADDGQRRATRSQRIRGENGLQRFEHGPSLDRPTTGQARITRGTGIRLTGSP